MDDKTVIDVASLPLSGSELVPSAYSNNASLAISPWDIRLVFSEIIVQANGVSPLNVVRASVVMSPAHAKALSLALATNVLTYEQAYGEIQMPSPPPTPTKS